MGIICKRLKIIGDKGSAEAEVLFDSGARSSVVRREVAQKVTTIVRMPTPKTFGLASNKAEMVSTEFTLMNIRIDGKDLDGRFYVLDDLRREVIIGSDFLQNWSIVLNPKNEDIKVNADPTLIELFATSGLSRW